MTKITKKVWSIEPHTAAKHTILRKYLQAWMPIMTFGWNFNNRAVILDGFAGPGEYEGGEDGSPIIMLKEAIKYIEKFKDKKPQLRFIFVEKDRSRFNNLKKVICQLFDNEIEDKDNVLIPNEFNYIRIFLVNDNFEKFMNTFLAKVKGRLAPSFAFIDPFGFKDTPYSIIQKLNENKHSEVFINFMYENINRFLKNEEQQENFIRLFGTCEWIKIVNNLESYSAADRRYFIHQLYKDQLHKAGYEYVISFEMKNKKNVTEYFLYYGTNHIKGIEKMKDAMWSVDNSGAYTFSDYEANQVQLRFVEFDEPDLNILADEIYNQFQGSKVKCGTVKDFVVTDTIFRKNFHSNQALRILEHDRKKLIVHNRKKHGYPDYVDLEFL